MCLPILKYIEDTISIFKNPLQMFLENINEIKKS